ncbi:hypothetical protein [Asanoa siamensis]|uniref:Uncharacterized protein n=1 Tax=Asanoa siamensis TaxID=926357 RepID=A0ABQ4CY35_9ACTN|nr:hypothetical protein [Asanoa siamensis]GIF76213.1 hypothetical protein Asi02nite_57310 [Asanoa siamensis]
MTTTTGEPATHTHSHPTTSRKVIAAADLAAAQDGPAAITPPGPGQSYCDIEALPDGVRVRCRRVPLEPGIVLTHDQWVELRSRLVRGELPDFAVELRNSWVTRIAPPGQEHHALYLWRDEIAALAHELRTGHRAQAAHTTERSIADGAAEGRTPRRWGSSPAAAAAPTPRVNVTHAVTDKPAPDGPSHQDAGPAALNLSLAQAELLTAIDTHTHARIVDRIVRVGGRRYSMRDLYTLRTAKLIKPSRDGRGLRDRKRFEITERGAAEARHRTAHIGHATSPPTEAGSNANQRSSTDGTGR